MDYEISRKSCPRRLGPTLTGSTSMGTGDSPGKYEIVCGRIKKSDIQIRVEERGISLGSDRELRNRKKSETAHFVRASVWGLGRNR